jgi:hypothetical protein
MARMKAEAARKQPAQEPKKQEATGKQHKGKAGK